ncbi:unnamed protein product [Onchocerca flexuosa]|uniref:Flocculation protein FLO11-like n=1 Tax=Onchocerca flexuosa TaxID=387005 RepID=A0A183I864_9BILA|nr:unnamed protein product [Onchocerca flexuosa]
MPEEISSSDEKFSTILDGTSIERTTVSSEATSVPMSTVTSETPEIFGTEILDKITTTIQEENTHSDVTLNEMKQKHESTKIAPINETKLAFMDSSSSTMFVNSRTTVLTPGNRITSTIITDSSSSSTTEVPSFTYASSEITHQPV